MRRYSKKKYRDYQFEFEDNLIRFCMRHARYGAMVGAILSLLHYLGVF